MEYVAFDVSYLMKMFDTIRSNVGSIFSMAIYVFISVIGVYVTIDLIQKIGK